MPLFKTIDVEDGLIGIWQMTETSRDLAFHFSEEELKNPEFQKYSFENVGRAWTKLLTGFK